jgi:predicted DNA-binding transcriptional regulator YafY
MQINRLFEIVYILLDKKIVTANELAERFEVSKRTIYRDVEALSSASIPVYTQKGKGGGIGLLSEFVLNKTLLSGEERNDILSALHGLSATAPKSGGVLLKLSNLFGTGAANWVEIDYSDWNQAKQAQFDLIKQAIISRFAICFDYFNTNGENSRREIEPLTLWFKSKSWYLKAFCVKKQDFRIFKLTRMKNIEATNRHFEVKSMPDFDEQEDVPPPMTEVTIEFDASQNYRVYDDFEDENIVKNPDGSFTVTVCTLIDDWFYRYIMSFGCYAKVLQPDDIRSSLKELLGKSFEMYS